VSRQRQAENFASVGGVYPACLIMENDDAFYDSTLKAADKGLETSLTRQEVRKLK